jgi:hypothetical protein
MQREKLYNLQRTAYLTAALFVFKIDKTLRDQILTLRRRDIVLVENEFVFPYLTFLLLDMFV